MTLLGCHPDKTYIIINVVLGFPIVIDMHAHFYCKNKQKQAHWQIVHSWEILEITGSCDDLRRIIPDEGTTHTALGKDLCHAAMMR